MTAQPTVRGGESNKKACLLAQSAEHPYSFLIKTITQFK
jgi:hypothetical protein